MILVATKNGRAKNIFPLLFCCCCWIRDPCATAFYLWFSMLNYVFVFYLLFRYYNPNIKDLYPPITEYVFH
jgi:hypothetical protein